MASFNGVDCSGRSLKHIHLVKSQKLLDVPLFLISQEATELAPTNFDYLARCSKAWSDATYLDEISGKYREKLTDQAKRDFNERALGYSEKVASAHVLSLPKELRAFNPKMLG